MQKLTKSEYGLSNKHELWNRIKELESTIQSLELTILCTNGDFDELNRQLTDSQSRVSLLETENAKLMRHNDYLLTLLSMEHHSNQIHFNHE